MMACHAWMYRPVTTNESLWRNWGWMQDSTELCGQQDAPVLYVSDQPAHTVGSPESMDIGGTSEIGESVEVATTEMEQPGIMEMHVSFKQGKIEPYISPALVSRFRKEDTEKLMKLLKDVACRSIQDEAAIEMVDLESLVQEDLNRMPVRKLRTLIPKLLIACYFSPEEISGKRKMKHVWERRPKDWPQEVPFKDPNNGGSDKQKPGKPQLLKMAAFLKDKYMKDIKKCVTQPVQDDSKPTMESALSAPTMPSMISSDVMERPPTETLQNRLREKMKKIAVVIYRDNPQQMNNITVAYEVVYDQFLSMQRDPREQFKYLQYGHTFENIIDQLIMGRQYSDQELQDQLMALYGYKDEEEMENMTCHSQQQVQTYWNTNSYKYPFMSNGYPLKCKDEPLSPKSLYGSGKELNCITQLNPVQLNINMRDGCHMDQLGNLERREAPPPELTYKTDKILKYENGHAQLELADHDDHLGSNASWYSMEKQMDPLGHSPQHQQASVIMPTSSAQDCAMTPTNQMVTQNSGNMELANEHNQYTYMQSSPNREPPSYSATMAAQTVCSSPHQLAVSGQGLSTPYLPSSMVVTTVSPLAQTAVGQMSSINQMSQSVVTQMGQTPTVNLPGLASTTPSVPLPPITTVTAVSHSPNNQLPSSMTTCPTTNSRQEKMTVDCQMDPKNSPPAQQYMQGETNINGLNSDPTELEMVMSVIEMDMHKNGATTQENAVVVPNGSHVALSDTVSAAFNTLDSQASVAAGDPIQANVPPFQDADGSMVPGQLENRKIGKRFKGNGEMPSPKKMRH